MTDDEAREALLDMLCYTTSVSAAELDFILSARGPDGELLVLHYAAERFDSDAEYGSLWRERRGGEQ